MTGVYGGLVIPPDRWFKQVWLTTFVIVIIHGRTLARVLYVLFEVPFVFSLIGMTHSRVAFDVDGEQFTAFIVCVGRSEFNGCSLVPVKKISKWYP